MQVVYLSCCRCRRSIQAAAAGIYKINKRGYRKMNEKRIETLYKLLERAEKEKDTEAAAALRWAIFQLENQK